MAGSTPRMARKRLDWVLAHQSGPLAVVLVDSERAASHAVAIVDDLYGQRVVMDHELANALPFSKEALDNCCGPA